MKKPPLGLFITGNNTEVGKTYVTALIAKQLVSQGVKVGVYKPAASGCVKEGDRLISADVETLYKAAGEPGTREEICPQVFEAALAPHLAAEAEGKQLDSQLLRDGISVWANRCDIVLVEGAGGFMSPISEDEYVADLAIDLGYPLLIVAANRLGVMNETLQTIIAATVIAEKLPIAGIVLNEICEPDEDISRNSNLVELEKRCSPPILGHVPYQVAEFPAQIDWISLIKNLPTLGLLADY